MAVNVRSSRSCIEDYLDKYEGISSYKLVPLYAGPGTLRIVCDTISILTDTIANDVHKNCMFITDEIPNVVLPSSEVLDNIIINTTVSDSNILTQDELSQIIIAQVSVFVHGGITRQGATYAGMKIGESFVPGQLTKFLLEQIPEISNIHYTQEDDEENIVACNQIISVEDDEKFLIDSLEVVFE